MFHASDSAVTAALTYTVNINVIAGGDLWPLTHAWTLAVEEHFYLLWPLLLVAARYRFTAAAIALVVSSTLWRIWLLLNEADLMRVYVGTDTRLADIAVGCLCAVAVSRGWTVPRLVTPLALVALAGASTLGMVSHLWGLPVIQLLAAALIVSLATKGTGLLTYRPLIWVGGLSYGLYLWHYPILGLFGERAHLPVSDIAPGLALTVAVSLLSMKLVEAPIRRRVSRRRPAPAMVHPAQTLDLRPELLGELLIERAQPEVEFWCRSAPPPAPGYQPCRSGGVLRPGHQRSPHPALPRC